MQHPFGLKDLTTDKEEPHYVEEPTMDGTNNLVLLMKFSIMKVKKLHLDWNQVLTKMLMMNLGVSEISDFSINQRKYVPYSSKNVVSKVNHTNFVMPQLISESKIFLKQSDPSNYHLKEELHYSKKQDMVERN
jgi:hypothetical protein